MTATDGGTREQLIDHLGYVQMLVRQGIQATSDQLEHSPLETCPEAEDVVQEMRHTLEQQSIDLSRRLSALGGSHPGPTVSDDAPRPADRAAGALGDDHALLQRLELAYLELQSMSRPLGDQETAEVAERGYQDVQYLIRERITRAAPRAAGADQTDAPMNPPGVVR